MTGGVVSAARAFARNRGVVLTALAGMQLHSFGLADHIERRRCTMVVKSSCISTSRAPIHRRYRSSSTEMAAFGSFAVRACGDDDTTLKLDGAPRKLLVRGSRLASGWLMLVNIKKWHNKHHVPLTHSCNHDNKCSLQFSAYDSFVYRP